jgi:hypothetical protein
MKNAVFWDVKPRGALTDVSEVPAVSIIRVKRIGELLTALAITDYW